MIFSAAPVVCCTQSHCVILYDTPCYAVRVPGHAPHARPRSCQAPPAQRGPGSCRGCLSSAAEMPATVHVRMGYSSVSVSYAVLFAGYASRNVCLDCIVLEVLGHHLHESGLVLGRFRHGMAQRKGVQNRGRVRGTRPPAHGQERHRMGHRHHMHNEYASQTPALHAALPNCFIEGVSRFISTS